MKKVILVSLLALSSCARLDSREHPFPCRGGIYVYPPDRCQWAEVKPGSSFNRGELRWVRIRDGAVIGRDAGPNLYP